MEAEENLYEGEGEGEPEMKTNRKKAIILATISVLMNCVNQVLVRIIVNAKGMDPFDLLAFR